MLELKIYDISLENYVETFTVDCAPCKDDNAFTAHNGDTVRGNTGDTITLSAELKRVPSELSKRIAAVLSADTVAVSYTNPAVLSTNFRKKKFISKSRSKGNEWDISLVLESAAPVGGSRL